MADVVISEFMDAEAVDRLRAATDVLYDPTLHETPAALAAAIAGCRALIVRNRTQVTADLVAAGSALAVVGRLGVGLDNIDQDACRARGVAVVPATGANSAAVAEYVIGALLSLVRGVYGATADVQTSAWPRERLIGGELAGRTLGLVGFGSTAREVARRARALDMLVVASDPYVAADDAAWARFGVCRLDLDELLSSSDAVSLHVMLNEDTRHMFDRERLARMKPGAVLINAARGGIVDEQALADALRSGRLGAAAVDVFEDEPMPATAPLAAADIPNLILTPHVAGVTQEANRRVGHAIADAVLRHLELVA